MNMLLFSHLENVKQKKSGSARGLDIHQINYLQVSQIHRHIRGELRVSLSPSDVGNEKIVSFTVTRMFQLKFSLIE